MKWFRCALITGAIFTFQTSWAGECFNFEMKSGAGSFDSVNTVALAQNTSIGLLPGDFQVLDANGTDGRALLYLPKNDVENKGQSKYAASIRLVGKPGTEMRLQSCLVHPMAGLPCNHYVFKAQRESGRPEFQDVTKEMLYVYDMFYGDGALNRFSMMSYPDYQYFWRVKASEKVHAQIRICSESTPVP